ncbi:hypothetical protein PQ459_10045 [Chryseobacterium sp. KACC 21268]|nr:hypothetical protein PQ459_10045 [Chryseobacterium sp. KACC 21268]
MKTLLLILSIFVLFGCRTKVTKKEKFKSEEYSEIQITKKSDSLIQEKDQKKEVKKSESSDQKKESATEIEIKGKAETGKPLEIFDIENGDTIQALTVTGNADVKFKSKRSNSDKSKRSNSESESENLLEKYARAAVKEENLKKAGKSIQNSAKDLKTTDTTTGIYITAIILGAIAIIMTFIFIYFKKNKKDG